MLSKMFFSPLAEHVEVGLKIQGSDEDGDNNSHLLFAYPQFTRQTDMGWGKKIVKSLGKK